MEILDLIENGKVKRFFRARDKFSFSGAVYHVTQRASGAEPLFVEENDYLHMLHLIKETVKKFNFNLFSFVLMVNHLHLLLKSNEANLSKAMKSLFENYAKFFNFKYKRKGHVFCGPYRSALCLDDSYLIASSIYIHLNPVRAGLVCEPIDYRWSSCRLFSEPVEKETFVNYKFILQILDEDLERAREKYTKILKEMIDRSSEDVLEDPKALDSIRASLIKFFSFDYKKANKDNQLFFTDIDLEKKTEELSSKKWLTEPQELEARVFLIKQMRSRGFSMAEIATRLKMSRSGLYKTLGLQSSR